ncbi:hypothetical protein [Vibrio cincinnatiensis]|jgi:hypothetical protein|nr:hypothetical protein [Vibrio cincinnatiensis]MCG3734700.1 hypothetical protein [Vibrio cincinnatiensis]MCG3741786.1 hypothetical protein [Vibrio cincinnatiensis]MCG3743522.1 hypothetical protein [Vibrio cincinnatiensis]
MAVASQPEHYKVYEDKVASCIRDEQSKPDIDLKSLAGLSTNVIATGIFYHKDKRLIECSAKEELYSLTKVLSSNSFELDMIKYSYLSIGMLDKEKEYFNIPASIRKQIDLALENRNLEINLISLFERLESQRDYEK